MNRPSRRCARSRVSRAMPSCSRTMTRAPSSASRIRVETGACLIRPLPIVVVLFAALAGASSPANAWSALGHQLVGALAQKLLTPEADAQVRALLKDEPQPTLAGVAM